MMSLYQLFKAKGPSGFGYATTAEQVTEGLSLAGKTMLVTGCNSGLGLETMRVLALRGAQVVGTARTMEKAREAGATVTGNTVPMACELADPASVRQCVAAVEAAGIRLDAVICNAGIMACPKGKTADGFETQFGTNHLGHFVLMNRIASLLHKGSRLVNLSSAGHRFSDVDLDDPNFEHTPYNEFGAYGRSKTANILFAVEFDRRHKGEGIRATAVHPGGIQTELGRHMTPELIQQMIKNIEEANKAANLPPFEWKTIPQGAATTVWSGFVARADDVGGKYCEDCHVAELVDNAQARGGIRRYALDPERAKALWAKSEEMAGERF